MNWDDGASRFFNPDPAISAVPLPGGAEVVIIDDVLRDPAGLVEWARSANFQPPPGYPYPGVVVPAPRGLSDRFLDFFAQHARTRLGARRTLEHDVRVSMVTTPPEQLDPRQWQCHRDRVSMDPTVLFVGSEMCIRDRSSGSTPPARARRSRSTRCRRPCSLSLIHI